MNEKKLSEMTVGEFLHTPEFVKNLSRVWKEAKGLRTKARKEAAKKKATLCAHPIDKLPESAEELRDIYCDIINKVSNLPMAQRELVKMFCFEAYKQTVKDMQAKETN